MPTITRTEYLEVNGVPLSTPAWWVTNLKPEIVSSPDLRGGDRLIPGAVGVVPYKRRITVTVKQLLMVIVGHVDQNGGAYADYRHGLDVNVEYLTANLGIASASGDGTVTATWHRQDGTTKTAAVHVLGLHTSPLVQRHISAVLELSLPQGVFI